MKHKAFWGLVLSLGLLAAATPAWAHHSFAVAFDRDKPVTVQAVVTEVKWENPHTLIYVDVKDKDGKVEKLVAQRTNDVSFLVPDHMLGARGNNSDHLR